MALAGLSEQPRTGKVSCPRVDSQSKMAIYLRAHEIEKAVREMYAKQGVVVLSQVRNGTGFTKLPRTADMLAVSTWPSRGLYAEGIEIKVSKADLMKELCTPAKAEEIAQYCRHWWLATPEGLTEDLAIPTAWGVIEVGQSLKAKIKMRGDVLTPVPMDTLFVCSVLRNYSETFVHESEVKPQIDKAREEERLHAKQSAGYRLKELEDAVADFKSHSGIDLLGEYGHPRYDLRAVAQAVQLIVDMGHRPLDKLIEAREAFKMATAAVDAALGTINPALSKGEKR